MYVYEFCRHGADPIIKKKYKENEHAWRRQEFFRTLHGFTKYDWMKNQSFCWKNHRTIKLQQLLTYLGFCFNLNEPNVLNRKKQVIKIVEIIKNFGLCTAGSNGVQLTLESCGRKLFYPHFFAFCRRLRHE